MIRTDLKIIKSNSRGLFNILLSTVYYRPYQVKYGIRNKIIKIRRKIKAHCLQIYIYINIIFIKLLEIMSNIIDKVNIQKTPKTLSF